MPGLAWVEITYLSPSKGCLHPKNSFREFKSVDLKDTSCIHSFVFVGDLIFLGHSLHLTSYQPRWEIDIGTYFPDALEKFLLCVFHVSLTLGFLNCLPVCFIQIIRCFSMFKFISLNHLICNAYKFSLAFNWRWRDPCLNLFVEYLVLTLGLRKQLVLCQWIMVPKLSPFVFYFIFCNLL